jgi:hypothetical protein
MAVEEAALSSVCIRSTSPDTDGKQCTTRSNGGVSSDGNGDGNDDDNGDDGTDTGGDEEDEGAADEDDEGVADAFCPRTSALRRECPAFLLLDVMIAPATSRARRNTSSEV